MKLSQPFIQLPYSFDIEQLQKEVAQFSPGAWMQHPSRMDGNSAVPLVSVDGKDNDYFSGQMLPTPHLQRCNYIKQIMGNFDEVIARSRLMRLAPGCQVKTHVDFNYHWYSRVRIHIPITTAPNVIFYCGDKNIHMSAGECWIFDSWRAHKVVNNSEQDRVHLVIDTAGSSDFWQLVEKVSSQSKDDFETDFLPYSDTADDKTFKTERFNVAPVMAPGELEALSNELTADFTANPDNDPAMVAHYTQLLRDLAKDWRALWSEYGIDKEGFPRYQALLQNTADKLPPNPRALVANSNNVGVNPIIMQRIIRAALFVEERNRFITN